MLQLRHFELQVRESFLDGNIPGACHVYVGEEATAVGICASLNRDDYIVSSHRGHGHCLAKGADPKRLMAELFGKKTGYCQGRGGSMHVFAKDLGILGTTGIVGGGLPVALGGGLHAKFRNAGQVCVCFFGDGAANNGTFHESINLAGVQQLPVIFVCENNYYATATSVPEATLTKNFADRASGYGIPGEIVDGNNVLEVYEKSFEAINRARTGKGPTLMECKTYRHFGHYVGEDSSGYRPKEEVDAWMKRDPVENFTRQLLQENVLDQATVDQMNKVAADEIENATEFANASPLPDTDTLLDNVFS